MNIAKEILLQHFFSLMPFVMFNIYYRDKMRNYDRKFIMITSVLCLFLSMTFGTGVITGFFYDSRFVIMFFGLIFGGLQTGFLLLFEFVLYRFYLGGEGTWPSMITMSIAFPLSVLLYNIYQKTQRKSLVILTSGFIISIIPLATIYIRNPVDVTSHPVFHTFAIPVQNAIGIWLLIALFQRAVSNKELFITYAKNEKMEAVSHVAASLVHEVRNPLTAVKGFLTLIRESPLEREKVESYIDICSGEIQRTEGILSEYLSISKPITEKREVVDLYHQLQAVIDVMRPYANMHNVHLDMDTAVGPIQILANQDNIKQVLVNFIKNAIEACTNVSSGAVTLRMEVVTRKALLTIKDNGIGMSKEQVDRLGSIYFSTKTKGTGLGLTFSYQAIHELGGSVSVRSVPQGGTQFTITFPVLKNENISDHAQTI
ncbi:sensor histidine kinase [Ammoniphilus resinae]|uniref:histidine kinase n=1 Tax=Ammoniphilus resinae TaxID=861532 RepID=A0ABS4GX64_9BACL|nr:HAMP domain-containing sensor histidine kinase [Ammoniphilus resinae]MBP1934854.1 two-component system sporulation sensor kinase B [Ammoniphilus resinae]